LAAIRAVLPGNTVVLTGADWGSVGGLLALPAEADSNVIYSFHIYEPAELTALGAYRSGLDATAMARLPFPVEDIAGCAGVARTTANESTAALIRFYCAQRWDSAAVARRIGEAGAWGRRNHVRVIAGEFGASKRLNEPARLAWLSAVTNACMQQGIGWALWGYDDSMGFALRPPAERHLDALLLAALGLRQPMLAK
jgi:endoglucanase